MGWLASVLGAADNDRVFNGTIGQEVIFNVAQRFMTKRNAELMAAINVFVDSDTTKHSERYKLPGGGYLGRRGGLGTFPALKANGSWDVGYPLDEFGNAVVGTDVDIAYMDVRELQLHLESVAIANQNTVRYELLYRLFNNTQRSFTDPLYGTVTVEPLANGDTVVYPPVEGAVAEATEDHYLESGYLATAISDTNNPYITIRQELEEHFGKPTGGDDIVVFINSDETAETEALTNFFEVVDSNIRAGQDTNVPVNLPTVPGKIIGRGYGVWVVEWDWIPSGYQAGVHLSAPAPLKKRVDEPDTGLPTSLALIAQEMDAPFNEWKWRHRFGFGAGNRLNGVIMELANGGTYSIPAAYA